MISVVVLSVYVDQPLVDSGRNDVYARVKLGGAMNKPVLLLDVDGVINVVARKPPTHIWYADAWVETQVRTGEHNYRILAAQPVLDLLERIHVEGLAEIRWHTTWQNDTEILADALCLPSWPVAHAPEFRGGLAWISARIRNELNPWWKVPAAERVVREEKRPLIWLDDDITWSLRRYNVDRELRDYAPTLTISPDEKIGLTKKCLLRIEQFLELTR
jgi:hypothetical protein